MNKNLTYLIALKAIPQIGDVIARRLISAAGNDASLIFSAHKEELSRWPGVPARTASLIIKHREKALEKAAEEIEFAEKHHIECYGYYDELYPSRLKHCFDAPLLLFYKGTAPLESMRMTAIVGTRKSTVYGRKMTEQLVGGLSVEGMTIVSGLAYGIDTVAHSSALEHQIPTIGVLGHGFRFMYPEENKPLAARMLQAGGLLTEFLSTEPPDKVNFPIRNRIIAGLSDAVVVIEAQSKGGALITAEMANSYSRDVFTFPGRADDMRSRGCNWLIRTNRATLIESAEHLKFFMNWTGADQCDVRQTRLEVLLNEDAKKVYDFLLEHGEKCIDEICGQLSLTINTAAMVLLELEFQGIVVALPGKRYQLKHL